MHDKYMAISMVMAVLVLSIDDMKCFVGFICFRATSIASVIAEVANVLMVMRH